MSKNADMMMRMKPRTVLLLMVLGIVLAQADRAQTARDYFNELFKAGGLDKRTDEYVCFDDRPSLQTFFLYADYSNLKDCLSGNGELAKILKVKQDVVNKGFLMVREYDKGVPHAEEDVYYKDGNTWITDPFTVHSQKAQMRMRLNVAQPTLRYQRKVEILNSELKVICEVSYPSEQRTCSAVLFCGGLAA